MKKSCLIVIGVLLLCLGLFACGSESSNESTEDQENVGYNTEESEDGETTPEDLSEKVKASGEVDKKGKLVVIAKNENDTAVDLEVEVEFYDSDNNIVGSASEDFYGVGADGKAAIELYETPEKFSKYKIFTDAVQTTTVSYYDKVKLSHNNNGEQIAVQVTNESKEEIQAMEVCVVYYRDGKIVGADTGSESDIKPGRSGNFNIDYPYSKSYDDVRFDKYKVFVNEAYAW